MSEIKKLLKEVPEDFAENLGAINEDIASTQQTLRDKLIFIATGVPVDDQMILTWQKWTNDNWYLVVTDVRAGDLVNGSQRLLTSSSIQERIHCHQALKALVQEILRLALIAKKSGGVDATN